MWLYPEAETRKVNISMTLIRRRLPFEILPMKGEESPYIKPQIEQINFELLFNSPLGNEYKLKKEVDSLWMDLFKGNRRVSYKDICERIISCDDSSIIFASYSAQNCSENPLTLDLLLFLSHFSKIIPATYANTFFSQANMDMKKFLSSLPPNNSDLMLSVINITHMVLSKITDYKSKIEVLKRTSELLVPCALKETSNPEVLLCLPVLSLDKSHHWLFLYPNEKIKILFGESHQVVHEFSLKELSFQINNLQITFLSANKMASFSYSFCSSNSLYLWDQAIQHPQSWILTITGCIPEIMKFKSHIPPQFKEHFMKILSSSDLGLASLFAEACSRKISSNRESFSSFINLLLEAGQFIPFIRYSLGIKVDITNSENTIFRDTSPITITFSSIAKKFGDDFLNNVFNVMDKCNGDLKSAIDAVLSQKDKICPQLKYLCSQIFRSTRRKFPKRLVPLFATSGMIMLRYLMPAAITTKSGNKIAQKLMNAFVFHQNEDEKLDETVFRSIAEFIFDIITYENITYPFYRNDYDLIKVLEAFAEMSNDFELIHQEISKVSIEHPMMWSILELLETTLKEFDDFSCHLSTHILMTNL